jgi:hypothetical protein
VLGPNLNQSKFLFIYLNLATEDKASSRRDMCQKATQTKETDTKLPPLSAGALCASHRGPYKKKQKKEQVENGQKS